MKSGVAAWVAAVTDIVKTAPPAGGLVVTITGDEEGDATDGTVAILEAMDAGGIRMDACVVGEPTSLSQLGDVMKIGRRGSMTADIKASGRQGHTAYPDRAINPLSGLVRLLDRLASTPLDTGSAHFDPSTLALTTIDTGNPANNVIPESAKATANIRFNDLHSSAQLKGMIDEMAMEIGQATGVTFDISYRVSGESFITEPGHLSATIAGAVLAETGISPEASTSGGTSDARFIRGHCPVVEFGLVGERMHQIDERVPVEDIRRLAAIYRRIIGDFFAKGAG